ncbi:hypothetical protein AJ79_03629 [Helicocarpus griseus UAMH5409]|uniref:Uncharacterized protein n=1 Tax=Helicocarpus griseus UAMH5409 TaxID=1447875 RepID=A0A2B7XX40_9EURO|nr:hypothetical protein AJ79_03629 [Helicocarpus griseus UAMH5409]
MKLNLMLLCLVSGLTPIFGAPEKRAAANQLETSPATKGNEGDVLAEGTFPLATGAREYALVTIAVTHTRTASTQVAVAGVLASWADTSAGGLLGRVKWPLYLGNNICKNVG